MEDELKAELKRRAFELHWRIRQILGDRYAVAVDEGLRLVELYAQAAVLWVAFDKIRSLTEDDLGTIFDAGIVLQTAVLIRVEERKG